MKNLNEKLKELEDELLTEICNSSINFDRRSILIRMYNNILELTSL